MVDIIMATYNGGKYLKEQLDSIFHQSYSDFRIIVRDDGSTDNTIEIINEYKNIYHDQIMFIQDDVVCRSSCCNFMEALKYSDAEYVMFSDQDDVWLPNKIINCLNNVKEIENRIGVEKPILVFGSYKPVDSKLNDINIKKNSSQESAYNLKFSNLLVQNCVNGCLMMINKSLAEKLGSYSESILMHDWWAALIASSCGEIKHVDEIMMLYRQHSNNVVGSVNVKSVRYRLNKVMNPNTKKACLRYLDQAELLKARCYKYIKAEQKKELDDFIALYDKSKLIRMISIIKGGYLKSDIIRIIGQLFYI